MQALLKKLNYRQEEAVHLFYVPEELEELPAFLSGHAEAISSLEDHSKPVRFAMLFVTEKAVLDAAVHALAGSLEGDVILWICYPKGSSKRYRCDFNRDTGWQVCGQYNLEPVRQVAVNEDWSALRFRKTQYIKQLTRSSEMALGDEAKKRIEKKAD
jgi:hypothetical protein